MRRIPQWSKIATLGMLLIAGACTDDMSQPLAPDAASFGKKVAASTADPSASETLYLIDNVCPVSRPDGSCEAFGNGSVLYTVALTGGSAVLTEVFRLSGACVAGNPTIDCSTLFDQAHIGATPDGKRVWVVQRRPQATGGNPVGYYDVLADKFVYVGGISGIGPDGVVLASFSPLGDFFVANITSDALYRVNPTTLAAEQSWLFRVGSASGPALDLAGADIAFDAAGTLFVYTNRQSSSQKRGLYKVQFAGADAIATHVADQGDFYTGLAFLGAGAGNLVMSNAFNDRIRSVNPLTGAQVADFAMTGDLTDHRFGDMTTGRLGEEAIGTCEGGVSKLVVKYIGSTPLGAGDVVGGQRLNPGTSGVLPAQTSNVAGTTLYTFAIASLGGQFSPVANGRLGNNMRLFINGTEAGDVHTSCSVPIYPGQVIGGVFEIVEVYSLKGGKIGAP